MEPRESVVLLGAVLAAVTVVGATERFVAPDGNDTVFPGGKPMNVAAWLARFAFTPRHLPMAVEAGYVWINEVGKHFLGAPFGGVKQSGFGREECLEELLQFTQLKNIHLRLRPAPG